MVTDEQEGGNGVMWQIQHIGFVISAVRRKKCFFLLFSIICVTLFDFNVVILHSKTSAGYGCAWAEVYVVDIKEWCRRSETGVKDE